MTIPFQKTALAALTLTASLLAQAPEQKLNVAFEIVTVAEGLNTP